MWMSSNLKITCELAKKASISINAADTILVGLWDGFFIGEIMKKMVQKLMAALAILSTLFCSSVAYGDDDGKLVDDAVNDTAAMLKDSKRREEVIKGDANAKAASDKVKNVTGGDAKHSQQIYSISADALEAVMKSANNDPTKAAEMLNKAQANPEAFFNSLPEDIKKQIRGVSGDIEEKQKGKP